MQDRHLYEYAVIRIVPQVEREEFLNVGVVLYCPAMKFLKTDFTLKEERLLAFSRHIDISVVREHLCNFQYICMGVPKGGPISRLDPASRFRWLTATRSTVVQTSSVHPGLCTDPEKTLERLHQQLVL